MNKLVVLTAAMLSLTTGGLTAGTSFGRSPALDHGQSVFTGRGTVVTTGHVGQFQTTTMPGGGGQGLLMNNANGTSTLIGSNGAVSTFATPR
jgi:hypothetical protein